MVDQNQLKNNHQNNLDNLNKEQSKIMKNIQKVNHFNYSVNENKNKNKNNKDKKISITLVYSPKAREIHEIYLELQINCSVLDALKASNWAKLFPDLDLHHAKISVWGRKIAPNDHLRDGDRLEICRPLLVDPKIARRERFRQQGSRASGLFAKRRAGAKPGY